MQGESENKLTKYFKICILTNTRWPNSYVMCW